MPKPGQDKEGRSKKNDSRYVHTPRADSSTAHSVGVMGLDLLLDLGLRSRRRRGRVDRFSWTINKWMAQVQGEI